MPAPEVLVFSTLGAVILIAALILWLKARRRDSHSDELVQLNARLSLVEKDVETDDEFEPAYESELTLTSIESLELLKDIDDEIDYVEENEEPSEELDVAAEDPFSEEIEAEAETLEAEVPSIEEAFVPEPEIESIAEVAEEVSDEISESPIEPATEEASEEVIAEEPETPIEAELAEDSQETPTNAETHSVEEIMAAAEELQAEVDTLASSDEDLRRATLRRAPHRHRRQRTVDENLDTQITELDQRLDALEALVSSIEQGLADFEPLLEDVDMTSENDSGISESEDGHAQAA